MMVMKYATPLFVYTGLEEIPNVKEMIFNWKEKYLYRAAEQDMYTLLKKGISKVSRSVKIHNTVRNTIKYNWPTILYIIVSYVMNDIQLRCLFVPLALIQFLLWLLLFSFFITGMVVFSVIELEKRYEV